MKTRLFGFKGKLADDYSIEPSIEDFFAADPQIPKQNSGPQPVKPLYYHYLQPAFLRLTILCLGGGGKHPNGAMLPLPCCSM